MKTLGPGPTIWFVLGALAVPWAWTTSHIRHKFNMATGIRSDRIIEEAFMVRSFVFGVVDGW
jgi:hypothetical protein